MHGTQWWHCIRCLRTHAWRKSCNDKIHPDVVIAGPYNESGADFLIHDTVRPQPSADSMTETPGEEDIIGKLTVEMLDLIFQRQVGTTVSIPPPCRLQFSRTLKASLDKVLDKPVDVEAWMRLLLLPTCTLNLYTPKSSVEERSGTRKKLQITAINQALAAWNEPQGCFRLVQNLLDLILTHNVNRLQKGRRRMLTWRLVGGNSVQANIQMQFVFCLLMVSLLPRLTHCIICNKNTHKFHLQSFLQTVFRQWQ